MKKWVPLTTTKIVWGGPKKGGSVKITTPVVTNKQKCQRDLVGSLSAQSSSLRAGLGYDYSADLGGKDVLYGSSFGYVASAVTGICCLQQIPFKFQINIGSLNLYQGFLKDFSKK